MIFGSIVSTVKLSINALQLTGITKAKPQNPKLQVSNSGLNALYFLADTTDYHGNSKTKALLMCLNCCQLKKDLYIKQFVEVKIFYDNM